MSFPPGAENPRTIRPNRQNQKVLKRVKFDPVSSEGQRMKVKEMQNQIEQKEAELNRLRVLMARNDPTDGSAAQIELNRLQAAFEQVNKMAKAKLEPVINQLNRTQAQYESKVHKMKMYKLSAKERDDSVDVMQDRIDKITSELEAPNILPVDQSPILTLLQQTQKRQCEIEETHRAKQIAAFNEKAYTLINDTLTRKLNNQLESEKNISRKAKTARMENEARLNQPEQVIDEDWILARHKLDKLRIMLEDAKRSVKFLNDTAEQLANSNKRVAEDLAKSQDELALLEKYLPGAPHDDLVNKRDGISRFDLTVLEAQVNSLDVVLTAKKLKTKSIKSSLDTIKNKLAELPDTVKKAGQEADQTKFELENSENELKQSQELKAELYSRKVFAEEEAKLLQERIIKQKELLESIQKQTEEAERRIEKQKTIMQMNEEMQSLKTMNFDKFTSTIANLMNIKKRI